MNEIHIEPTPDMRSRFAAWCLTLNSPPPTTTSTGWNIPLDTFPSVPAGLLVGAFVDGFPYDTHQQPQTAAEAPGKEPLPVRPTAASKAAQKPAQATAKTTATRTHRKRAARKTAAPKNGKASE